MTPDERQVFWQSEAMRPVRFLMDRAAGTDATVLIEGESGVGKSLVARVLHDLSARRDRPLVKVCCAALPAELLESELFGYERGAFTGAQRRKLGRFELAHEGTILLDEVGELPFPLQAKLLHVLQEGRFARLGGSRDMEVDVRIIAASNRDLRQAVDEGLFRADLYYRLDVLRIYVPSLKERREEIPALTDYFLRKFASQYGRPVPTLSPVTLARFLDYPWPGNVRELENIARRVVLLQLSGPQVLAKLRQDPSPPEPLPSPVAKADRNGVESFNLREAARQAARAAEHALLKEALERTRWNRAAAAQLLNISYRALQYKIKDFGFGSDAGRGGVQARGDESPAPGSNVLGGAGRTGAGRAIPALP